MKKNKNACILGSIYHSKIDPTLSPISQGDSFHKPKDTPPLSLLNLVKTTALPLSTKAAASRTT
jgi:hypothetical protein